MIQALPDRIDVPGGYAHEVVPQVIADPKRGIRREGPFKRVRVAYDPKKLYRKAGAAAAGGGGVRIDDPERCSDQIVNEIDFGAAQERDGGWIDEHHRGIARDYQIIVGLGAFDVEFVLKARAASAFDADTQHRAIALGFQDFSDPPRRALADGDVGFCHPATPYAIADIV
ncbi:hypothetical protein NWI01_11840 [Nitrobacter winogradskyi]|uniref:Uncharacterized protein n=1 Tax=Nitrobacter winogradskyi TaxID=913 RepID=A0A4Y3W8G9_NITWI|nr:hypothetical protein NWI01_11840 [Nitrobacter winogradskyi]